MKRQLQSHVLSATAATLLVFVAGCESLNNAAMDATAEVAEASNLPRPGRGGTPGSAAPRSGHRGRRGLFPRRPRNRHG